MSSHRRIWPNLTDIIISGKSGNFPLPMSTRHVHSLRAASLICEPWLDPAELERGRERVNNIEQEAKLSLG